MGGGLLSVAAIVLSNELSELSSNLKQSCLQSLHSHNLKKNMNSSLLSLAMCEFLGSCKIINLGFFSLGKATILGEGKLRIQISSCKIKLASVVEGYPKVPFAIATTPR